MAADDLNPPLGTTTPEIFMDNVKRADELVNGPAGTVNDRAGEPLDTWRQMMAKNDEVRQNIIPLSKQYQTLEAAQADIINIPEGSTTYYRSPDDSALAIEVINNGGTLEATGRKMISQEYVDASIEQINTRLSDNTGPREVTTELDYRDGYVINADGSVVDGSAAWRGYWMNVRAGDKARYEGPMGSSTEGETIAVFIQFDLNGVNQGNLATYTSTGAVVEGLEFEAEATHDGLIYVRALIGSGSTVYTPKIYKYDAYYINSALLDAMAERDDVSALSYLMKGQYFRDVTNEVWRQGGSHMDNTGAITTGSSAWTAYRVPVKAGNILQYLGPVGGFSVTIGIEPLVLQLNERSEFVGVLGAYMNTNTVATGSYRYFIAEQDGYIWVNRRTNVTSDFRLMKSQMFDFITNLSDGEDEDYDYVDNIVINADGSIVKTDDSAGHFGVFVPVEPGDFVVHFGRHGSATVGEVMNYIMQMDADYNVVEVLSKFTSTGSNTYMTYSTAVATQSGYLYVRGRFKQYSKIYKSHKVFATDAEIKAVSKKLSSVPAVSSQLERLPVQIDNTWNYNGTAFIQDAITEADGYQYIVMTGVDKLPRILQRKITGGEWNVFDLSTVADNPLHSPTSGDGHNVAVVGVTKGGYILVFANMHSNVCRGVISQNPHDITSWRQISFTPATQVTYPRLVKYPDGTTQAFWREGSSGSGVYVKATFNDDTLAFNAKKTFISAVGSNPYEQRVIVDNDGGLHLCWGYRTSSDSANTNYGLFYAKSSDKGETWTNAAGNVSYAIPLNDSNAEKITDAPAGSGYCNQNGACHDLNNRYHTVIWQYDAVGATQFKHIWFDGSVWKEEMVSDFNFSVTLATSILNGMLTRPVMFCTNLGRICIVYHTTKMGRERDVRVIDVTTPGAPVDYCVANFDVGTLEFAVNTDLIKKGGDLKMLLTRGSAGSNRVNYQWFTNESVYILTANIPLALNDHR